MANISLIKALLEKIFKCWSLKNQSSMDLNENVVQRKSGNIYWQSLSKPYGIHFVMAQRKTGCACVFMLWLQTVFSSGACTVSVVVPDLFSLFSPKLNLKQGLLSDPEGYMFVLIKTMSLMDKDVNVGSSWGWGCVFFFIGRRSVLLRWHSIHCLCENTQRRRVFQQPLFDQDGHTPFIPERLPVAVSYDSASPHNYILYRNIYWKRLGAGLTTFTFQTTVNTALSFQSETLPSFKPHGYPHRSV